MYVYIYTHTCVYNIHLKQIYIYTCIISTTRHLYIYIHIHTLLSIGQHSYQLGRAPFGSALTGRGFDGHVSIALSWPGLPSSPHDEGPSQGGHFEEFRVFSPHYHEL